MSIAEITKLLENYFTAQSDFGADTVLDFWHPGGDLYLVGNQGEFRVVTIEEQIAHTKEAKTMVPDLKVEFLLDEIELVTVHEDLIASVHVRYRMLFPEGQGVHRCFYNLAKIDGQWGIVNAVDRGFQSLLTE